MPSFSRLRRSPSAILPALSPHAPPTVPLHSPDITPIALSRKPTTPVPPVGSIYNFFFFFFYKSPRGGTGMGGWSDRKVGVVSGKDGGSVGGPSARARKMQPERENG